MHCARFFMIVCPWSATSLSSSTRLCTSDACNATRSTKRQQSVWWPRIISAPYSLFFRERHCAPVKSTRRCERACVFRLNSLFKQEKKNKIEHRFTYIAICRTRKLQLIFLNNIAYISTPQLCTSPYLPNLKSGFYIPVTSVNIGDFFWELIYHVIKIIRAPYFLFHKFIK